MESKEQLTKREITNNLCNKITWTANSAMLHACLNRIITVKWNILLKMLCFANLLKEEFSKLDGTILGNTSTSWSN